MDAPRTVPHDGGMFDTIAGLPVHPLVLHLFVVLGPLTAVAALVVAFVPRWRPIMTWPLSIAAALTAVSAFVTKESGEALEHRVEETALVERHAELGDVAGALGVAFAVLTLLVVLVVWRRQTLPVWLQSVGAVLVGLTAVALIVVIVLTGHSGAVSVWGDALS